MYGLDLVQSFFLEIGMRHGLLLALLLYAAISHLVRKKNNIGQVSYNHQSVTEMYFVISCAEIQLLINKVFSHLNRSMLFNTSVDKRDTVFSL